MLTPELFQIAPEVAEVLANNKPVVALESTVIAHGLPRPTNRETAQRLEKIVREARLTQTAALQNSSRPAGAPADPAQRGQP